MLSGLLPRIPMQTIMTISRVWIEEGCIVCDACEDVCPEVFHVQDDSCTVREGVNYSEFIDAIKIAAEDCPTEVIKFE